MKKFKRIGYILLIIIVVVLSLTIYTNANKDNTQNQKEKVLAEIKFVETKLINLLNSMNNIKISDYNIVTTEISKDSSENTSGSSSQGGQSGGEQQGSTSGEGQGNSQEGEQGSGGQGQSQEQSSGDTGNQQESKKQEIFDLKSNDILVNESNINWDTIKIEIENLYRDLPSITMDLYQIGKVNQEDILGFNNEYDNLTNIVKDENKEEVLNQLTKIYDYLPKFLRSSEQEELYTTLVETKTSVFKGYAKLDSEKWKEISNDIKSAIDTYSKLLSNTNVPAQKQSNISKGYIMINELQNAVNLKDKEVFLIKYKNLLDEIDNM